MLSWFKPRLPLPLREKLWVEYRMRWLADQFGLERLLHVEFVVPEKVIPMGFRGTDEDLTIIYRRLCERLGVPCELMPLEVVEDEQMPDAVGHYDPNNGRPIIRLKKSQLKDSYAVAATLAHEISHHLLLGDKRQTGSEADLEWTTDLLPVFFGVGIFAANATVRFEASHIGNYEWWSISRQGYLPSRIFGYAFALANWFREEQEPVWARHLRPDAAEPYRQGIKYLLKTKDSLFRPDSYRPNSISSTNHVLDSLRDANPAQRILGIWESTEKKLLDANVISAIGRCLGDRSVDVAAEAAAALSQIGEVDEEGRVEIARLVWSPHQQLRRYAIQAAGRLRISSEEIFASIRQCLSENDRELNWSAINSVRNYGALAGSMAKSVLHTLDRANINGDADLSFEAAAAIDACVADPKAVLREYYSEGDPELYRMAREAIYLVEKNKVSDVDSSTSWPFFTISTDKSIRRNAVPAPEGSAI